MATLEEKAEKRKATAAKLKEALKAHGVKAAQISRETGISKQVLSTLTTGKISITTANAVKIAGVLGITASRLAVELGLLSEEIPWSEELENLKFRELLKKRGIGMDYFLEKMNVSLTVYLALIHRGSLPTLFSTIVDCASILGINVDQFIEQTKHGEDEMDFGGK